MYRQLVIILISISIGTNTMAQTSGKRHSRHSATTTVDENLPYDPNTPVYQGVAYLPGTLSIRSNQVAFDSRGPKMVIIQSDVPMADTCTFELKTSSGITVKGGKLKGPYSIDDWSYGAIYYRADFSDIVAPGTYHIRVWKKDHWYYSNYFTIGWESLARMTIPSILHYYRKQRANTPIEWKTDEHVKLYDKDQTVDMRGGWCDASGDVSKYFSHLAYANVMGPQQIPLVTWTLASVKEEIPNMLISLHMQDSIISEALWGADYLMRAQAPEGYFRMIVFSYFDKDPKARRVVGLLANSITDTNWECGWRQGGGMAIAALARVSTWNKKGSFTGPQYLDAAEKAFDHLMEHNLQYEPNGKENIIDDYCALMAATELWKATGKSLYQDQARKRAANLEARMSPGGYFIANDSARPFWHSSDAGLPVIALARYLSMEKDTTYRSPALATIKAALDYNLRVTAETGNPYGYARQTFMYQGKVQNGFFIPHDNETGWWWQGENARLASLATAALVGGRLVYPQTGGWGVSPALAEFASNQLSWILGANPYSVCFLYQFGNYNVPYMHSNFGHGSERGGVSNGITGKEGRGDGSGIDFKTRFTDSEWRWTEQWIPHAAWFLQALAATSQEASQSAR